MTQNEAEPRRCAWAASGNHRLMTAYHDAEWGVPIRDDGKLFEFLILEGMQAGLSWQTILNKRDNYRKALSGFDPVRIARYGARDVNRLLGNEGIVRNRLKIESTIGNAQAFLDVRKSTPFHEYIWSFVGGRPTQHRFSEARQVPATTPESDAMSKDLKKRGFRFVGSTICYAFMQAVGMVNDHTSDCFRYGAISKMGRQKSL